MDEITKEGEQPITESITQEESQEETVDFTSPQSVTQEVDNDRFDGSLGKFKDAQSLLTAYNNLQAEFTKKCQALSQLKTQSEDASKEVKETLPIYERPDWTEKVGAFLEKNKQAQPFAKDIANLILQDEELSKSDSALDLAFAKIISQSFVAPAKVVEDEKFVNDYILTSEKVKNAVLNLYFKELQNNKVPPVLNDKTRTSQVLYKVPSASSLSEAKDIVKQMFDSF